MNRIRIYYLVCTLLTVQSVYSQVGPLWQAAKDAEVVQAYQKAYNWFTANNSYAFKLKYTSFKNHTSAEVKEVSEGYCKRINHKYRTVALGTLMVQNEMYRAVIDTLDKFIVFTDPDKGVPVMADSKVMLDLLKNTRALKKKKESNKTTYRIEFNKNSLYEAYEFTVNDKGFLEKLVYYYSEQTEERFESTKNESPVKIKTKPRLEITFDSYEVPAKITENDFMEKNIVADAKKIVLLNKYKGYGIKDYRHANN